jgi:hypothetical protein
MPHSSDTSKFNLIFDWIGLTAEEAARFHWARTRKRGLSSLAGEAFFMMACLTGQSPKIDEGARQGMRHSLDELRLLMAALPAHDESSLTAKLAALDALEPLVQANAHFTLMLKVALRADIARFMPPELPSWFLEEERERQRQGARERDRKQKKRDPPREAGSAAMSAARAREILGLSAESSEKDIRAAYTRLMKAVHPDTGGSNVLAALVNEARDFLLDEF